MKKELQDKLFRYVKEGRIKRIRSVIKKHKEIIFDEVLDSRRRTLLHVACLLGEDSIVRVLINSGASIDVKDSQGNTPLHLALHHALQVLTDVIYKDLVEPLWQQSSKHLLRLPNDDGETPRKLRKKFKWELRKRREDRKIYEEHEERVREEAHKAKEWHEKLFFELGHDEQDLFTNMSDSQFEEETYDQWADRIANERHRKHFVHTRTNETDDKTAQERKDSEASERTRFLHEQHEAYIKEMSQRRAKRKTAVLKTQYESQCEAVFVKNEMTQLRYSDIPWPCPGGVKDMVDMIKTWSEGESDKKRFLREQQVRWHPDRFLQKCGDRLDDADRDTILTDVNHLSQGINALTESEQQGM